jgi:hypothetical protein
VTSRRDASAGDGSRTGQPGDDVIGHKAPHRTRVAQIDADRWYQLETEQQPNDLFTGANRVDAFVDFSGALRPFDQRLPQLQGAAHQFIAAMLQQENEQALVESSWC